MLQTLGILAQHGFPGTCEAQTWKVTLVIRGFAMAPKCQRSWHKRARISRVARNRYGANALAGEKPGVPGSVKTHGAIVTMTRLYRDKGGLPLSVTLRMK